MGYDKTEVKNLSSILVEPKWKLEKLRFGCFQKRIQKFEKIPGVNVKIFNTVSVFNALIDKPQPRFSVGKVIVKLRGME